THDRKKANLVIDVLRAYTICPSSSPKIRRSEASSSTQPGFQRGSRSMHLSLLTSAPTAEKPIHVKSKLNPRAYGDRSSSTNFSHFLLNACMSSSPSTRFKVLYPVGSRVTLAANSW